MESVIKESKGLKRQLELKIQAEEVNRSFLKNYQKIQKKVKIPGFRQGKVPLINIKQNYKDEVSKEVLDDLFKSNYPKALEQTALNPVSNPALINCELEEGQEALLLLELEVHPEVKAEHYLDLELEKKKITVTKENIDKTLEEIQYSYKSFEEDVHHKETSQKGDCLSICFSVFDSKDNQILKIKEQIFEDLGKDAFLEGFDERLFGLKTGEEKEFLFSFPNSFLHLHKVLGIHSQLGSQTLQTKVKLLSFKKIKLPAIDDEFAKKFKVQNVKELKAKIEEDLKKNLEKREKEKLENSLLEKLIEKNPVELPMALLEDQIARLKEKTKKHLEENYNFSPADQELYLKTNEKEIEKELEKEARFSLHISYLSNKLIKDLKINVKPEDIANTLKESFPNKTPQEIEEIFKKGDYWDQFLFLLRRRKLMSHLLEQAKIKEVD